MPAIVSPDLLTKNPSGEVDLALSLGPGNTLDGFRTNARVSAVWDSHPGQAQCDVVFATDPDSVVFLRDHARRERVEFLPTGIDAKVWPAIDREGGINVGVVSGGERVLRAWQKEDRGESQLIPMLDGWTVPERIDYYASVDVLVSLSPDRRSGRIMKEFMATGGVPVITVGGEHRNVWNPDACFEVGLDGSGLEALFGRLGSLRGEVTRMGRIGKLTSVAEFHWPNLIERLLTKTMRVM